jgi:hypothetical protein
VGVGRSSGHLPLLAVWTGCVCRLTRRDVPARSAWYFELWPPEGFKYGCPLPHSPHSQSFPPANEHFLESLTNTLLPPFYSVAMSFQSIRKSPSNCEAQCPDCGMTLSRQADLNRHRKVKHPGGTVTKYVGGTMPNCLGLIVRQ